MYVSMQTVRLTINGKWRMGGSKGVWGWWVVPANCFDFGKLHDCAGKGMAIFGVREEELGGLWKQGCILRKCKR